MPQPVTNAYVSVSDHALPDGSAITYTCYQHYLQVGGNILRFCSNGVLTGQPPVCQGKSCSSCLKNRVYCLDISV